jgi:hypothetical protein
MSKRLPCCVPFCRRTISAEKGFSEWICPKHWRLLPGSPARLSAVAMWRRVDAAWERCKRQAIERSLGL